MVQRGYHMFHSKIEKLYILCFVGLIWGLLLLFLLMPKVSYSQFENRPLQSELALNWTSVWDKSYTSKTELFISDQFPYRQKWFMMKSFAEQMRLMSVNNGILNGKDHYLFEAMKEPAWGKLEQYVDSINKFSATYSGIPTSLLLVPTSVGMYPQRLPAWAQTYSQKATNSWIEENISTNIQLLNGFTLLEEHAYDEKPIYYYTDHHWTSYGAYLAYAAYMKSIGIEPLSLDEFNITTVTDQFYGSYDTKGQFWNTKPDHIERFDANKVQSTVHILESSTTGSMYEDHFLDVKDKYSYFQGGVHALMTIHNEPLDTSEQKSPMIDKLLVIKDSYAHALLPFLANHAKDIYVVDLRFYKSSIRQLMEEQHFDRVLMVYNTSTFVQEQSLLMLKY